MSARSWRESLAAAQRGARAGDPSRAFEDVFA